MYRPKVAAGMVVFGCLGLLMVFLAGGALVQKVFREEDGLLLAVAGPAVMLQVWIVWSALTLPTTGLDASLALFVAGCCLGGGYWVKKRTFPAPNLARIEGLFLFSGAVLVALYALYLLSIRMVVEDSFFLHTVNIGLMLRGYYPPVNFLGEALHGHHGTDLLIALVSRLTSVPFLDVQWLWTTFLQVLTFLLLYAWLRKDTGSRVQAGLSTGLVFFGANFCSFVGLLDLLTNNQATASLGWVTGGYVFFRILEGRGWWLAGLVLAADALIYEIHFVMMMLTCAAIGLALGAFQRRQAQYWRALGAGLGLACLLASVQGGPVTHLLANKLSRSDAAVTPQASMQAQQVSVRFPKERLFELRFNNLRPSRPFETRFRPWLPSFAASGAYTSVASEAIVSLFWLPVWMMPLSLLWFVRQRSLVGFWFFSFGGLALLIPSLVDFGFYEQETARWLSVVSTCWTACFGLMLGGVWARWREVRCSIAIGAVLLLSCLGLGPESADVVYAYRNPGRPSRDGSPAVLKGAPLLPSPAFALEHHYGLGAGDWAAANWLRDKAERGERILMNHRPLTNGDFRNRIACVVGLAGLLPTGVTGAPLTRFDPPGFNESFQSRLFWATGRAECLGEMTPGYLLVNPATLDQNVLKTLREDPAFQRCYQAPGRELYRVERPQYAPSQVSRVEVLGPIWAVEPGQFYRLKVRVTGEGCPKFRYREYSTGLLLNQQDSLLSPLGPGQESLALVAPFAAGAYHLEMESETGEWVTVTTVMAEFSSYR